MFSTAPVRSNPSLRAFTLIEVVSAISILILVSVSTALALIPVRQQARLSREIRQATSELQGFLESLRAAPFNETLSLYPPGFVKPLTTVENGTLTVTYDDISADPLLIRISLSWETLDNGTFERSFLTVKTE